MCWCKRVGCEGVEKVVDGEDGWDGGKVGMVYGNIVYNIVGWVIFGNNKGG